ncbi:hypothetical protein HDU96_002234 [Phlyctochytrium bullatum]|nr:hypothetical protein HDU96_002234 [Phlyctochytrium bullatum]
MEGQQKAEPANVTDKQVVKLEESFHEALTIFDDSLNKTKLRSQKLEEASRKAEGLNKAAAMFLSESKKVETPAEPEEKVEVKEEKRYEPPPKPRIRPADPPERRKLLEDMNSRAVRGAEARYCGNRYSLWCILITFLSIVSAIIIAFLIITVIRKNRQRRDTAINNSAPSIELPNAVAPEKTHHHPSLFYDYLQEGQRTRKNTGHKS